MAKQKTRRVPISDVRSIKDNPCYDHFTEGNGDIPLPHLTKGMPRSELSSWGLEFGLGEYTINASRQIEFFGGLKERIAHENLLEYFRDASSKAYEFLGQLLEFAEADFVRAGSEGEFDKVYHLLEDILSTRREEIGSICDLFKQCMHLAQHSMQEKDQAKRYEDFLYPARALFSNLEVPERYNSD